MAPGVICNWPKRLLGWAEVLVVVAALALACPGQETRKIVARTAPDYPELARKMHLSGKVKLEVVVSAAGAVASAQLVGGNPVFEKSALDAVKQWKFESAKKETKEVVVLQFDAR